MNLEDAINSIEQNSMSPSYENEMVDFISKQSSYDVDKLIQSFLNNADYQVRMMGIRLVKRCIRDKAVLASIVELCFEVQRLNELQKWYSAILSRYSHELFVNRLKKEIEVRNDVGFEERHKRALKLGLADYGETAKQLIKILGD